MKYIDLFAGIGGFALALDRLGHECVYTNEWDKYAAQIYEKRFNKPVDRRSITDVPVTDIPDHDILCGGFPCQAFSIAGKRGGFQDTRGTLFYDIARIAKAKRPAYLFLENVKGLLSHDNGRTFQTIMRTFDELGYELQWQVLNSKDFGVPQNRERVFIIGHLRGEPRPEVFPLRGDERENNGQVHPTLDANYYKGYSHQRKMIAQRVPLKFLNRNQKNIEGDYAYTVDSLNSGGVAVRAEIGYNGSNANATKTRPNKTLQVLSEVDNKTEIQQRGVDEPTSFQEDAVLQQGVYEKGLQGSLQNGQAQVDGSSLQGKANLHEVGSMRDLQRAEKNGDTPQRPQRDKQQPTKSSGAMSGLPHEATSDKSPKNLIPQEAEKRSWAIRRLTPLEAERLQGFPDGWTDVEYWTYKDCGECEKCLEDMECSSPLQSKEKKRISDTQRYKCLGNAVTVNVIEAVAQRFSILNT